MISSVYFRPTFMVILLLASTFAFAQTNTQNIKAKWSVEKFDVEKNTPQVVKAKQDLEAVYFTFGNNELVISKKTETIDSVIKRGPYLVSGNFLTIGKDKANILLLSKNKLTINIPGQGVLYLVKM